MSPAEAVVGNFVGNFVELLEESLEYSTKFPTKFPTKGGYRVKKNCWTLRVVWPKAPIGFSAARSGSNVNLSWNAGAASVLGAALEVSAPADAGNWRLVSWPPITGTNYTYSSPGGANEQFRLRWAEKISLGSSTVTNLTQGVVKFVP